MRIISTAEYAGTREQLNQDLADYLSAIEAHRETVNEPAPLPPSELVRELAETGAAFVLEAERGYAWKSPGLLQPVVARRAYQHEVTAEETWVSADPDGLVWDGVELRPLTQAEINRQASVTARQARLALNVAGLLADVEAAIAAEGGAVAIEWEYASTIDRASPLVASMAAALELTEQQLDALFAQAAEF